MQVKLSRRRHCAQNYGGLIFTEMQMTTARDVMYVRGLVNLIDGMRCP
jgi:hypothetical protein